MRMLSPADTAALIILGGSVAAYAIGGGMHIAIDYVHGKRLLAKYWAATDTKIAAIKGDVVAELKAQLPTSALSAEEISAGFDKFFHSAAGQQWSTEFGEFAAEQIERAIVTRTTSAAGAAARTAQSQIERLISTEISFGNPVMDGLWAMVPLQTKRRVVAHLARIVRKASPLTLNEGELEATEDGLAGVDGPSADESVLALYRRP